MEKILRTIGYLRSSLKRLEDCPHQAGDGAPDAWMEIDKEFKSGLEGLREGDEIWVLTWLHKADRDRLMVHPRGDESRPLTGVFNTRSPHRPNPIGLHKVKILEIQPDVGLRISPIEVLDGTPVVDIKSVMLHEADLQG